MIPHLSTFLRTAVTGTLLAVFSLGTVTGCATSASRELAAQREKACEGRDPASVKACKDKQARKPVSEIDTIDRSFGKGRLD